MRHHESDVVVRTNERTLPIDTERFESTADTSGMIIAGTAVATRRHRSGYSPLAFWRRDDAYHSPCTPFRILYSRIYHFNRHPVSLQRLVTFEHIPILHPNHHKPNVHSILPPRHVHSCHRKVPSLQLCLPHPLCRPVRLLWTASGSG
jgi:hypothetical protein